MKNLSKELNTVTIFSKVLAAVLFVSLPFVAFFFGMQYQYITDLYNQQQADNYPSTIKRHPTPTLHLNRESAGSAVTENWTIFSSKIFNINVRYPKEVKFEEDKPFPNETDKKLRNIDELRFVHENGFMSIYNNCIDRSQSKPIEELILLGGKAFRYSGGLAPPPPVEPDPKNPATQYGHRIYMIGLKLSNGQCLDIQQSLNNPRL